MKKSRASTMILDAYWCADGVWRVSPVSVNDARAPNGIPSVGGYTHTKVTIDELIFLESKPIDYEEIAKKWWGRWASTTDT